MHHCVQQGVWTGVTSLVAMASNAPPDVGPWPLSVQAEVDPMALSVQVVRVCRFSCSGFWLDDPAWFTRALAAFLG
jgi:hypothetical protein